MVGANLIAITLLKNKNVALIRATLIRRFYSLFDKHKYLRRLCR